MFDAGGIRIGYMLRSASMLVTELDDPGDGGLDGGNSTICREVWPSASVPFLVVMVFLGGITVSR